MSKLTRVVRGLSLSAVMVLPLFAADATSITNTNVGANTSSGLDYANAIPLDIMIPSAYVPAENVADNTADSGEELVISEGNTGSGELLPATVPASSMASSTGVAPMEYDTNTKHPYTTSKVDAYGARLSKKYPNRVTGKLFFKIGSSTYVCSAASIKPGVVVTAAHCVYDTANNSWYSDFEFIPAYYLKTGATRAAAPYGKYGWQNVRINMDYVNLPAWQVSDADVAFIVTPKKKHPVTGVKYFAGERTGWYGTSYGSATSRYSFVNDGSNTIGLVRQMGYPVSHDSGGQMQQNDSQGFISAGMENNTVIGSRMTGGSSGGPWLVNYGQLATLGSGTTVGTSSIRNVVMGTTSWGYTSDAYKQQGASPFTTHTFGDPLALVCDAYPENCGL